MLSIVLKNNYIKVIKMRKKVLINSLLLLFTTLLFVACGDANKDSVSNVEKNKEIRVGYQKGNTLHILKESGYLDKAAEELGYSVRWEMFTHGNTLMEGIYADAIDYGHAADGPGIFAQATNKPFVYVGADAPNPDGVGVMVRKDSGITSLEQLKGKKIGTLEGGNHHYLAILALESAGLTVEDVEWVYPEDAAQGRSLFETGAVDALASYDPFFASAEVEMDVLTLTEDQVYDGYPNRTFYFASENFAKNHPELIELILEATDRADQWANENKDEVIKTMAKALDINENVIERQIYRRTFGATKITNEIIEAQQKQADKYHEIGLIPEAIDVTEKVFEIE